MPYILENDTKIISNFFKLEKQAKNRVQTKIILENSLFA